MTIFPGAGSIEIRVSLAGEIICSVEIRSTRPVGLTRVFVGREPSHAPLLARQLFSLCGAAQAAAASQAVAWAQGRRVDSGEVFGHSLGVLTERVFEGLRGLALGWPDAEGGSAAQGRAAPHLRDAATAARGLIAASASGLGRPEAGASVLACAPHGCRPSARPRQRPRRAAGGRQLFCRLSPAMRDRDGVPPRSARRPERRGRSGRRRRAASRPRSFRRRAAPSAERRRDGRARAAGAARWERTASPAERAPRRHGALPVRPRDRVALGRSRRSRRRRRGRNGRRLWSGGKRARTAVPFGPDHIAGSNWRISYRRPNRMELPRERSLRGGGLGRASPACAKRKIVVGAFGGLVRPLRRLRGEFEGIRGCMRWR